jgi:hypothetical protein
MSDGRLLPPPPSVPARSEPRQLGWSHGPPDLSPILVGHGPQANLPSQAGSKCESPLDSCGTSHLCPHGLGLPRNSSQVFYMSHGDSVRIIHGDQSTILPPAGYGNGKIQCDGPLSAAFSRPFTAFRGGVNRRCRRWNSPSPPSSYPFRDHWSRDWVHATVKERAHSPHNGVPALSAATSPIIRR